MVFIVCILCGVYSFACSNWWLVFVCSFFVVCAFARTGGVLLTRKQKQMEPFIIIHLIYFAFFVFASRVFLLPASFLCDLLCVVIDDECPYSQ